MALLKKLSLVLASTLALACGVAVPTALGSPAGPKVTVQIKTRTKTLRNVVVRGEKGSVKKGRGRCSGDSAAGALDAATHGRWTGTYSPSLHDFFLTSILGVAPKKPYYWFIFVNGKMASTGACGVKLRTHETIVFKIEK